MKRKLIIIISFIATLSVSANNEPLDTLRFEDGSWYVGEISDSLFNGKGTMQYADSTFYTGQWKNGLWDGKGFIRFPDGDTYQGDFKEHKIEGEGVYKYANGAQYEGSWKDNMFNGAGTLKYTDGGYYAGEWKDDKRDGIGILYSASENKLYQGQFENDLYVIKTTDIAEEQDPYIENNYQYDSFLPKIDIGIAFCSNNYLNIMITADQPSGFWGGGISVNTHKYARGSDAKYYNDDGDKVVLVKWNEYRGDEFYEGDFPLLNIMACRGINIADNLDIACSLGLGFIEKYRNCRAREDGCPNFEVGEIYNKTKFGGICLSYGAFARYYIAQNSFDYCFTLGVGNIEGLYFGLGVRF